MTKAKTKDSVSAAKKKPSRKAIAAKPEKAGFEVRIGPPVLTRYEKSRIIGARALQISMGAPILLEYKGKVDPIQMAEEELRNLILPIMVTRSLPTGEEQSIPIRILIGTD